MPATPEYSVIIANDLRTGRSVYFTEAAGWSESVERAELLSSDQAELRLQDALSGERDNLVIDPYLVGMNDAGSALDIREHIRLRGPSIFPQQSAADIRAA